MAGVEGFTSGVARSVVLSVHGEGELEPWRQIHFQFEPTLMVRQEQILVYFAATAKTVSETRELFLEMYRKLKAFRDLTEEAVSVMHEHSVLTGFLDPLTMQRTACRQSDPFGTL